MNRRTFLKGLLGIGVAGGITGVTVGKVTGGFTRRNDISELKTLSDEFSSEENRKLAEEVIQRGEDIGWDVKVLDTPLGVIPVRTRSAPYIPSYLRLAGLYSKDDDCTRGMDWRSYGPDWLEYAKEKKEALEVIKWGMIRALMDKDREV